MRTTKTLGFALLTSCALSIPVANAQLAPPVEGMDGLNLFGLGIGVAPDYMGSSDNKAMPAPIVRYQFKGTQRYVMMLGPLVQFNMLDNANWRFGPQLTYRGGRGNDVDDATVKQMVGINPNVESGAFVSYVMKLSNQKLHQINFTGDVGGGSNGTIGGMRMMYWKPLSQQTFLNVGVGMQYADDKWMNTYFGVNKPHDIALYPTLNGQAYNAGGGVKGVNIPFGVSHFLSKEWLLSVGGRFEKLQGDAKDSPVTEISGKDSQVVGGVAISYVY